MSAETVWTSPLRRKKIIDASVPFLRIGSDGEEVTYARDWYKPTWQAGGGGDGEDGLPGRRRGVGSGD